MNADEIYRWLEQAVRRLPNTKVTITWGEPHFRVGEKIFSGWGRGKDGRYSMGAKLDKDKQAALVASDPRFAIAPYVGKHGWVSFSPGDAPDLDEMESLLIESYCNITGARREALADRSAPPRDKPRSRSVARRAPAKSKAARRPSTKKAKTPASTPGTRKAKAARSPRKRKAAS